MGAPPAAAGAAAAAPSSAARQGDHVDVDAPDAEVIVGVDQTLLEEELLLEAERLKKQSEEKQNQQQEEQLHTAAMSGAEAANGVTPALSADRFHQLNVLLDQTSLYSMFLSEQMDQMDNQQTANGDDAGAEPPSKRKKKANSADADKPGTSNGKTAELLPLMTGGEMRDYQLKGVKWMISLYQNGLNGILADQMGLGKTVQTIGFISHLRSKNVLGPYLIVAPLSTLPNWISEFARWAPSIPAILYHGSKQERAAIRNSKLRIPRSQAVDESFPVICTSYEIVIADRKFLQKYHFKYIVVDEGHRLKNFDCKLVRELRTIPTNNKLLLTGTPLQNNLPELWSLLNFLLPDVFTSLGDFQSWFDFTADDVGGEGAGREGESASPEEQRAKVVSKLHNILRPFLLRRLKADVETSLPRKKEMILYAQMTKTQRDINKKLVEKTIEEAMRKLAAAGTSMGGGALTSLNNTLMQCRKNCNHPDLITGPYDGSLVFPPIDELVKQCGKMQLLDRLLKKLKARGHKVLIFSQMTKMLDLLEYYLEGKGITPCRIDGNVSYQDRQRFMKEFNSNPEVFCFLLSTRAGGLGINLTAADTVIIYDSDWNPHQDMQAMDRCHRIGQTRPVHVYRLCTSHSVEGRMLERANSKLKLMRIVMKKGEFEDKQLKKVADQKEGGGASGMKAEELLEMLKDDIKQENISQSADITDGMLERLLDRSDLVDGGKTVAKGKDLPTVGVGYEVVEEKDGASLLANVE